MKKLFKNIKDKYIYLFVLLTIVIFSIAFDPVRTIDSQVLETSDKLKHIAAFFTLSYFLFESTIKFHDLFRFLILVFLAFFIEYVQSIIGREASLMDFLASTSGVLIYILLRYTYKKVFKENLDNISR